MAYVDYSDKLKRCPFCCDRAVIELESIYAHGDFAVAKCGTCGVKLYEKLPHNTCFGEEDWEEASALLVERWNNREYWADRLRSRAERSRSTLGGAR